VSFFAPALGALWNQVESYGLDPAVLFREQGVDPGSLFDAGARVPIERLWQLTARASELSGDPLFGLRYAEYFRPAHLGALGFAWLASSSLRAAFERLARYSRVIQEKLTVELYEDQRNLCVAIDANIPAPNEGQREDAQLAVMLKFCRIIAGRDFNPVRVRFRQPAPRASGSHFELFRCPLEFDAGRTELLIDRQQADARLTGSNDQLAQLNEHIVVKYLAHSARHDIVNRTKAAIIDAMPGGSVSETTVAKSLHMTPRNLHRKLQKEGTSFKLLLTDLRKELARQYIQDRSKTLTEISFLLGFAEVSSFSRAFKNWTGQPPSEARASVA